MKIRKQLQTISRIIEQPVQKKKVHARATILTFNKPGSSKPISKSRMEVTGYSRTHREETSNATIEQVLTDEANRTENNKNKPLIYGNKKLKLISTIKVEDIEQRKYSSKGWGNCAEAHAAYLIAKSLNSENQFLESLFIDRAVGFNEGYHDKDRDKRCRNCSQWCPPNSRKSAKLPKNE